MIKKLFFVILLTGFGHFITLATIKILSKNLSNNTFAFIGELDALIIFLTSVIAFGLQLSTTRKLAISDSSWKNELYSTQQARITLSLFLFVLSISGFYFFKNILFLLSPLIALNADYALYGRGKPISGAFFAFLRLSIPSIFLIIASIFFIDLIIEIYFASLILTYFLVGFLIARKLDVTYLVRPSVKSLIKYYNNLGLGIASVAFIFFGVGLINIVSLLYNDETISIIYVALKLYVIFKGVRRILVQSFFKDLKDISIALKVDVIAIFSALIFLLSFSIYSEHILPLLVDEQYLIYPKVFLFLGITALISSFTTSTGTRLLLKEKDNQYINNIIVAVLITIILTIISYYVFGNKPYLIILCILIGEIYLSISNVLSLKENKYFSKRLFKILPAIFFFLLLCFSNYFVISNYSFAIFLFLLLIYYFRKKYIRNKLFTTQWLNENILIKYPNNFLFNFYINIFFKNWKKSNLKQTNNKIIICFSKNSKGKFEQEKMYSYSRNLNQNTITTTFNNVKIYRSILRTLFKFFIKKNMIGTSELYMSLIRKSIIEPIEFFKKTSGWSMLHACVFKLNGIVFVISAESKVGKSTLVKYLIDNEKVQIYSDNYCFIKGDLIRTIEEPFRYNCNKNSILTFYGRSIIGRPNFYEEKMDKLIVLNRGKKNEINSISNIQINSILNKINNDSKEGISSLYSDDPIMKNSNVENQGSYKTYKAFIAEGLHNLPKFINLLKMENDK